jgi:hypothetical protein
LNWSICPIRLWQAVFSFSAFDGVCGVPVRLSMGVDLGVVLGREPICTRLGRDVSEGFEVGVKPRRSGTGFVPSSRRDVMFCLVDGLVDVGVGLGRTPFDRWRDVESVPFGPMLGCSNFARMSRTPELSPRCADGLIGWFPVGTMPRCPTNPTDMACSGSNLSAAEVSPARAQRQFRENTDRLDSSPGGFLSGLAEIPPSRQGWPVFQDAQSGGTP